MSAVLSEVMLLGIFEDRRHADYSCFPLTVDHVMQNKLFTSLA